MTYSEALAARVRRLLSDRDDVAERPMFGGLTFMVGGHMCCGVNKDELIVRLRPADIDAVRAPARAANGPHSPADARIRDRRARGTEGPGTQAMDRPGPRQRHRAAHQETHPKEGTAQMSEVRIADEIRVDAPIAAVWLAIEDPAAHARWHPFVTDIAGEHELDHVRTCSVLVGNKHGQTSERCVEHDDGNRIAWKIEEDSTGFGRMVSDWQAGFVLAARDGATIVTAESTFRPNNPLVRAMLPVIRRKFHKTQRTILAGLNASLETTTVASA
jgi:uncharacterized protein YndB with AHSA1/START domain